MLAREQSLVCRAPAVEVWKLLHDPVRFVEWWDGLSRVEPTSQGATMYTGGPSPAAVPTRVTAGHDGKHVVINCLATDDVFTWLLEPLPVGCRVTARVEVSDDDEARLAARHASMITSLPRLVAAAERHVT